jgi:ABC-type bacteriocin/lantibiotic exporter with double-glycine peptidase domain
LIVPISLLFGVSIFYAILAFGHPWIYKIVFENLIPTHDKDLTVQVIMCLFSIGVLNVISNILIEMLSMYIKMETTNAIRIEITRALLEYSYSFFQKNQPGELIERIIPEVDGLGAMAAESVKVVSYALQIALLLILIAVINLSMFGICALMLFLYAVWYRLYRKPIAAFDARLKRCGSEFYGILEELFDNIKNIKLFNLHDMKMQDVNAKLYIIEKESIKNSVVRTMFGYGNLLHTIANIIIIAFCFHAILHEQMAIGYYLVFSAMIQTLIRPMDVLLGFGVFYQTGIVSAKRIEAIMTKENEKSGTRHLSAFSSALSLNNVSFSYGNQPVLKNLSMHVKKGQNVAIVGGSGSGKTTIAHLLVRLYEPTRGKITIDSVSLPTFDLSNLRNKIGLLSQDVFLFNDTVSENINPSGALDATEVKAALVKSQMPQFVNKLEYVVGEQGQKLSGGERQRLSVARLLGRKCEIIILDEATANLDPRTAQDLLKTFAEIRRQNPHYTFITITHNLESLYSMDLIYVLENGTIAAEGRYDDLVEKNQSFKKIFSK